MRPARPLPFGFAGVGGRQCCSVWEWDGHSRHLASWRPSRPGKRSPADYQEHALELSVQATRVEDAARVEALLQAPVQGE